MDVQSSRFSSCRYHPQVNAELWVMVPSANTSARRSRLCWLYTVKQVLVVSLFFMLSATVQADEYEISKNWRSIAIKGYDPVAYFTMKKPVKGKSQFEYRWHDARWRFVSEEHMQMFTSNPEKYAPQFGGYCAEGMALGRKASIDPRAWLIVEDRLYLNYSLEAVSYTHLTLPTILLV